MDWKPKMESIPWGAGSWFCFGHILAATEMQVFLEAMARKVARFDLLSESD